MRAAGTIIAGLAGALAGAGAAVAAHRRRQPPAPAAQAPPGATQETPAAEPDPREALDAARARLRERAARLAADLNDSDRQ